MNTLNIPEEQENEIYEKINQETLSKVYGPEIINIKKSINELEKSSINYFKVLNDKFNKNYQNFLEGINKNIISTACKLLKAFKLDNDSFTENEEEKTNLLQKISSERINLLKRIIITHQQILESIDQNMNILKNFLNISNELDREKPIEDFLSKEFNDIVKGWIFLKLDLEKFNFSKVLNNTDLDQNFKDFILKVFQGKNFVMNIKLPKFYNDENTKKISPSPEEEKNRRMQKESEIRMIEENKSNLIKLKMTNISEADSYFGHELLFEKMKKLYLENVSFKNNNIIYQFPYLEKLTIKCCPSFEMSILKNISTHLNELYLSKNGFVNYEFNDIIVNYLANSQSIRDNLSKLSFANNNITKVELSQLISKPREIFRALKELDFRKNKINKFTLNNKNMPELKFINCCDNNLNRFCFEDYKNIFVLQSGNTFLLDKKFCFQYYNNLQKIIELNTYPINYLNLSYMPSNLSNSYVNNIKINNAALSSLKKIDLSYNGLRNDTIFTFLEKNKGLSNLKSLILNGNEIDDSFFEKFLEKGYNNILVKLQNLSINSNLIGKSEVNIKYTDEIPIKDEKNEKDINKLRLMYKFIKENKNLIKLNITKNPISEIYSIVPEINGNADVNEEYVKKDDNGKIIINCFFSFLLKIKNELLLGCEEKSRRSGFNIRFDCRSNVNKNSENYPYGNKPIVFKNNQK